MNKRRYDAEACREDILDAAEGLFAERGFAEVSTAAIAGAAMVSQSQIHYYFGSKRALWDEVFKRRFADYHAVQSKTLDQAGLSSQDRMARSIQAYFAFFQENPRFVKLMMRAALEGLKKGGTPLARDLFARGAGVIAQAQAEGGLRKDVPAQFILLGFLSMVTHYFQFRDAFAEGLEPAASLTSLDEAYLDFILRVYLKGIAP